jgi:hypothetical protein
MDKVPPDLKKDEFYEFQPFRVPKYQVQFSKAFKLADIQGYKWYSPAAIYLWGRFSETTLSDIVSRMDLRIFWYRFEKPIFSGFSVSGDSSWNHALWACQENQWPRLVDLLLEVVQFDMTSKTLYHYALQSLSLPDPLNVDKSGLITNKTPEVEIYSFAVLTNKGQYAFGDNSLRKAGELPRMATYRPDPKHVSAANKLFSMQGLTQDKAFENYKSILNASHDESYLAEANKKHNERISRDKQS